MSYNGGVVTLTSPAGPGGTCILAANPVVAGFPKRPNCTKAMRFSARLAKNPTASPLTYTFSLNASRATVTLAANPSGTTPPVYSAPVITLQPSPAVVGPAGFGSPALSYIPNSATFTAAATASPTPSVQWYISPRTASGPWTAIAGATSSTLVLNNPPYAPGANYFEAVFSNSVGTISTNPVTLEVINFNSYWSGYVDTSPVGQQFTSVTGTFVVPTTSCVNTPTYQADWVGLDSATVEQDGIIIHCVGGTASYYPFYEYYGNTSINNGSSIALTNPVGAGDTVTASVSYASGLYTFVVTDSTKGWTSTTTAAEQTVPAVRTSAEWVLEVPWLCSPACNTSTFSTTTPVNFTSASATTSAGVTGSLNSFSPAAWGLRTSGAQINYPSIWDTTGTSFSITGL